MRDRVTPLLKKLFIKNYGCQMNVYDSARMADVLAAVGYATVESAEEADLVILNTCHIREKATEKLYSELGRLRRLTRRPRDGGGNGRRGALLAVAGCVAQAEGVEILRRAPWVDMVVGPQAYHRLPEMIAGAMVDGDDGGNSAVPSTGVIDTDFPAEAKFAFLPDDAAPQGPSAFLTVQEGCDRFCAFCVVPYTRGAEYSRPACDVLGEARRLVAGGAREITLLGQNVNAYRGHGGGLAGLIRELAEIDGVDRIRYTTSHPADMDADLIAVHGEAPQLMPYLHLPVQSGSDRVLERMRRRHGIDDYLRVVDALRRVRADIALSSDFIVGHPGETEADFKATLALVRKVGYAQAYSFKYSPRPGTPAAAMDDQVPEEIKAERLAMLQDLLNSGQRDVNRAAVGTVAAVLFDRRGRQPLQLAGRSPHMQAVHVNFEDADEAASCYGAIADVRITAAHANSLSGQVARPMARGTAPQAGWARTSA